MNFSMMTYSLMRFPGTTPQDCVKAAVELGMTGIDWVTTYDRPAEELRKMSHDAGLTVAAHTFFVRGETAAERLSCAERSLDDACKLTAPVVMIVPLPFAGVADPAENRKRWCEILDGIAPLAAARNLLFSVENFPGKPSGFVTAADFYEAKKAVPALKLTFDNGNASTGEDQLESLKKCFPDVVHVHFKDWLRSDVAREGYNQMGDGRYYAATVIGKGVVDSRATLKLLESRGYRGFINLEYESFEPSGVEALRQALDYLRGSGPRD